MISSTPIPGNRAKELTKLYFDQATQTEKTSLQPPLAKIEEMEMVLQQLYGRFQALVLKVNNQNTSIDVSEPENNDVSYMDPTPIYNEAWVPRNNVECDDQRETSHNVEEVYENQAGPIIEHNTDAKVNVKMEDDRSMNKENTTRVRRMSAQTTGTEMVMI